MSPPPDPRSVVHRGIAPPPPAPAACVQAASAWRHDLRLPPRTGWTSAVALALIVATLALFDATLHALPTPDTTPIAVVRPAR